MTVLLILLLFSLVLWLSVRVSALGARVRRLTQHTAILEKHLRDEINKNSEI
ncbi:MAG: DUF2304 family protein [Clostridia bacterium]|nr:DUF2304 family protein [Clostridia bacterium]